MNRLASQMDKAIKAKLTPVQRALYQNLMDEKFELALCVFAHVAMGKRRILFFTQAYEQFLTVLALSGGMADLGSDKFFSTVDALPMIFPKRIGRKELLPLADHAWYSVMREYEAVSKRVATIKKKKWTNPNALSMSLKEALPGFPDAQITNLKNNKPSEIARSYVCWKFKLSIGHESLKKDLALLKQPTKLYDLWNKAILKNEKQSLSIGRPPKSSILPPK